VGIFKTGKRRGKGEEKDAKCVSPAQEKNQKNKKKEIAGGGEKLHKG